MIKPLRVLKWLSVSTDALFVAQLGVYPLVGAERFGQFSAVIPYWLTIITILTGVCFGANRLKDAQAIRRMAAENGTGNP